MESPTDKAENQAAAQPRPRQCENCLEPVDATRLWQRFCSWAGKGDMLLFQGQGAIQTVGKLLLTTAECAVGRSFGEEGG